MKISGEIDNRVIKVDDRTTDKIEKEKDSPAEVQEDIDAFRRNPSHWERDPNGSGNLGFFTRVFPPPPPHPEIYAQKIAKQEALEKGKKVAVPTFEELYPPSVQKVIIEKIKNRYGIEITELKKKES